MYQKKIDAKAKARYVDSEFASMTEPDLQAVVDKSREMEGKYLKGRATFSAFCMSCRKRLYLRARPSDVVPRWCLVDTQQPHRSCSERQLWLGDLDLPEDTEGDEEEQEEEGTVGTVPAGAAGRAGEL